MSHSQNVDIFLQPFLGTINYGVSRRPTYRIIYFKRFLTVICFKLWRSMGFEESDDQNVIFLLKHVIVNQRTFAYKCNYLSPNSDTYQIFMFKK